MKCSICGNEFGDGINCQNCGVDRVTGLGNYSGFEKPNGNNGFDSSDYIKTDSTQTMVCYACKEIIPADSLFCPYCRKKLWVKCPNCGHEYSSQYPNCNQCGTNLNQYLKEEEEKERIKKEVISCVLASYCTDYIGLWVFILLISSILIPFFIASFGESRDKSIIEKWKKEHPNDPRSKYL